MKMTKDVLSAEVPCSTIMFRWPVDFNCQLSSVSFRMHQASMFLNNLPPWYVLVSHKSRNGGTHWAFHQINFRFWGVWVHVEHLLDDYIYKDAWRGCAIIVRTFVLLHLLALSMLFMLAGWFHVCGCLVAANKLATSSVLPLCYQYPT